MKVSFLQQLLVAGQMNVPGALKLSLWQEKGAMKFRVAAWSCNCQLYALPYQSVADVDREHFSFRCRSIEESFCFFPRKNFLLAELEKAIV